MKNFVLHVLAYGSLLSLASCSQKPEPFQYGKDECYYCKMGVIDPHFGGEVITKKGKVFKFDDLACMIRYLKSGLLTDKEISRRLTVNYSRQNDFIDADKAIYLVSPAFQTPMNGHTASFVTLGEAQKVQVEKLGNIVNWNELFDTVQ